MQKDFRVVNGNKKTVDLLKRAVKYMNLYDKACSDKNCDCELRLRRIVLYGVKCIELSKESGFKDYEEAARKFEFLESIMSYIGKLTPRRLMEVFPIDKVYDGDRYQCKDYFYTMDVIRKHGIDTPIGEEVFEFLTDYTNKTILTFVVNVMCAMSAMRRFEGQKGIAEEFFEKQGMPTYTKKKEFNGKEYLINNQTGERHRICKRYPRYLKPLKGGAAQ